MQHVPECLHMAGCVHLRQRAGGSKHTIKGVTYPTASQHQKSTGMLVGLAKVFIPLTRTLVHKLSVCAEPSEARDLVRGRMSSASSGWICAYLMFSCACCVFCYLCISEASCKRSSRRAI